MCWGRDGGDLTAGTWPANPSLPKRSSCTAASWSIMTGHMTLKLLSSAPVQRLKEVVLELLD